jgi:hypothetical protein
MLYFSIGPRSVKRPMAPSVYTYVDGMTRQDLLVSSVGGI